MMKFQGEHGTKLLFSFQVLAVDWAMAKSIWKGVGRPQDGPNAPVRWIELAMVRYVSAALQTCPRKWIWEEREKNEPA